MKLRGGMMPPQGMPRPDAADARRLRDDAREARSIDRALALARPWPQARPSSEPHRVRQRRPRSARSRDRRHRVCCRPTMRATGSTTSPACCASRRRCSSSTSRRRARSAAWRSAPTPTSSARLPRAARRLAGGSRRGPAARHARRPALHAQLPAGRRVRIQRHSCSATSSAT